jgi:hypothetical protein
MRTKSRHVVGGSTNEAPKGQTPRILWSEGRETFGKKQFLLLRDTFLEIESGFPIYNQCDHYSGYFGPYIKVNCLVWTYSQLTRQSVTVNSDPMRIVGEPSLRSPHLSLHSMVPTDYQYGKNMTYSTSVILISGLLPSNPLATSNTL